MARLKHRFNLSQLEKGDLYPYQFLKFLLLYVARWGENKNAYWILVGKSERKRPLGKPKRICEDNIKPDVNMER